MANGPPGYQLPNLPGFGVQLNFKGGQGNRDARGRFTAGATYDALEALTLRYAKIVQADAVVNLADSYQRPGVRSNRLLRVTADPKNRTNNRFGFAVGLEDFLNRSEAKYWRTIEEGSAATWRRQSFVGLKVYGQWAGRLSGWGTNAWGRVPHSAGPFGRAVPRGTGKLMPYGGALLDKVKSAGMKPMVVTHNIEPHRYYQRAWLGENRDARFEKDVANILRNAVNLR